MTSLSPQENQRYRRHFSLPQIGASGQQQLKSKSVLLIGAGGIGCPAALYLTSCGIGQLGIVDDDQVELSNLQRQILYRTDECGLRKVDAAAKHLMELNPHVALKTYPVRLSTSNASQIMADYDLVIDGSDNFATRYLVNDVCALLGKPMLSASIFQFGGQLGMFNVNGGPCYRCLYPSPPSAESMPNCSQAGVLGVVPGILAMLAVNEAIKFLLEIGDCLVDQLVTFDALTTKLKHYHMSPADDCLLCAKDMPFEALPRFQMDPCQSDNQITLSEMTVFELEQVLSSDRPMHLLDVREAWEREICLLDDQAHIPLSQLATADMPFQTSDTIVIYCHAGVRSLVAAQQLQLRGFNNVMSLQGGISAWIKYIDPSMNDY